MRESRLIGVVKERENRKEEREIEWKRQKQRNGRSEEIKDKAQN